MSHEFGDCSFCGGKVTEKLVRVDYRVGEKLVIVERVPAGVCGQCGEQYFTARVAKTIEELARSAVPSRRTIAVPVKTFPAEASMA